MDQIIMAHRRKRERHDRLDTVERLRTKCLVALHGLGETVSAARVQADDDAALAAAEVGVNAARASIAQHLEDALAYLAKREW